MSSSASEIKKNVQEYYSINVQKTADLKTSACCSTASLSPKVKEILCNVHDDIKMKSYGCGSPLPDVIDGCTVLDLGCGAGIDSYVASKLVGEEGRVIGIDMTEQQLAVAREHIEWQRERFGFKKSNVEFHLGQIEDLKACGITDESVDVVISNCVINLSPDKESVFREIFRVLKPGGELYFSDVFSSSRIPEALQQDKVLHGECLAGALYTEDFRRMLAGFDCPDFRVTEKSSIAIEDPAIQQRLGAISFYSLTIRAFKLAGLEDRCEDYGHVATYKGTIDGSPMEYQLDDHHLFIANKPSLVCGNTALMLSQTRLGKHFEVHGDFSKHFGLFDCIQETIAAPQEPSAPCC